MDKKLAYLKTVSDRTFWLGLGLLLAGTIQSSIDKRPMSRVLIMLISLQLLTFAGLSFYVSWKSRERNK